ncbi:hypothetical protein [Desulfonatronospira sp.]|uniref:hypothetical protein n=1 Tax=Desulfonatronospira sp. TaxID=1962951 RepID=UPI0025C64553|nr:hypothetical protein [Desulfonatronospira sp.]
MKLSPDKYQALADMYMQAGLGDMFSGSIHNLSNHVQILDMQLNMLNSLLEKDPEDKSSRIFEKVDCLSRELSGLRSSLRCNSEYSYYTRKEPAQVNVDQYIKWFLAFRRNCLYFKHKILCRPQVERRDINLDLPPFYLTICLDQGIRNALEEFRIKAPEQDNDLVFHAGPAGTGGAVFLIISKTRLQDIDPWEVGSSSKPGHLGMGLPLVEHLCRRLGWQVTLQANEEDTRFQLQIPGMKSR